MVAHSWTLTVELRLSAIGGVISMVKERRGELE